MSLPRHERHPGALWVALTGGLASGKSTAAKLLDRAGATVLDADRIVGALYRAGQPGSAVVAELFGPQYLTVEGAVDAARLAAKVFSDDDALAKLEQRIHPLVGQQFVESVAETDGVVVLEGTLLVEAGFTEVFDVVVTVEADPALRLERAIARGLDRAGAQARLDAQGDGQQRRDRADIEIVNDGSLAEFETQVLALYKRWKNELAERAS